jgi:hypothetical protein
MKYGVRVAALALAPVALGGALAITAGTSSPASAVTHHRTLPPGMHWRTVWYQIDDCGKHNAGKAKIIVWRGKGDMQSAMFCPDGSVWPS